MLPRYRMDKKGMVVERIGSLITISILIIILIVMAVIFNLWWTTASKWFLLIPVALIVSNSYIWFNHPTLLYVSKFQI
ncbi:hypothetical protein [Mammaliicoccus sciuri]|uniref:hypothetical protein n=1 Tax=Mammaliicoccus sciuri TaxID=1296 RepID=UPI0034DDBEA1